jgi:hypothetical protein
MTDETNPPCPPEESENQPAWPVHALRLGDLQRALDYAGVERVDTEKGEDAVTRACAEIDRLTARNAELVAALRERLTYAGGERAGRVQMMDAYHRELLARIDAEAAAKPMEGNEGRAPVAADHETIHGRLFCGIDWSKDALVAAEAKGRREAFKEVWIMRASLALEAFDDWLREKAGR